MKRQALVQAQGGARRWRWVLWLFFTTACWLPNAAQAWWNHEWSYRKQVVVDTQAAGVDRQDGLADVPVLIRLHEGVFKFSDANRDGSDLRFIAADDKTPLKYHIEKFDPVFNLAFVWVQLPQIQPGAKAELWMYYGNAKAVKGDSARETFDPDEVLVYHFAERGTAVNDATGYANHSRSIVPAEEGGLIGTAARFDGESVVVIPAAPSLGIQAGAAFTWSAWIKPATPDQTSVLYQRRDAGNALIIGLAGGAPYVAVDHGEGLQQSPATPPLNDIGWHHVAVTGGPQLQLFIDGKPGPVLDATLPALASEALVGSAQPPGALPLPGALPGFVGTMDELRIAKVARGPAYLYLSALNQGLRDTLIAFGQDEQLSSWSSGYIGVILRSVTLDGWVVIAILMVMAVISWVVMYTKAQRVSEIARGNKAFLKLFHAVLDVGSLSHMLAGTGALENGVTETERLLVQKSPLYRMFNVGMNGLRMRLKDRDDGGGLSYLSPQAIEAIRAELDSSLAEEDEALNQRMVLLTIAVSGGPFLGLLGTVMGVMITFAAIAASGDVNINAIAPGVAAALAATVAGLIVAIPALFGYNYLTTRINVIATQMRVFMDALTARMAESFHAPVVLRNN